MDTAQVQPRTTRDKPYVPMLTALLKLLAQPTRMPTIDKGKRVRAGITKNKSVPRDKSRVKMARESRRKNRRG